MQAGPVYSNKTKSSPVFSPWPYGVILFIFAVVIFLGMWLTPSPSGVGTHEELGLPPCGFLTLTGYPCPSCGLTTVFALLLHGRIFDALRVQPFGVVLFICLFLAAGLSVTALILKIPFSEVISSRHAERFQLFLLVVMILSWIYKISIMKWM